MPLSEELHLKLQILMQVFLQENTKLNLSAFRTPETCWTGNILDSLAALEVGVLRDLSHVPSPNPLPSKPSSIPQPLPPQEEGEKPRGWKKIPTPENLLYFAREMRKEPTKAEEHLWQYIREDQLGCRLRRQYPIGGRILDFFCPKYRIAIELDGSSHHSDLQQSDDHMRDGYLLEEYGIATLRLNNEDVLRSAATIVEQLRSFIQKHSSSPSLVERGLGGEEIPGEIQETKTKKILDLGTGGGFPLLPLALCLTQCSFTGLDSVQKKIAAVQRIVDAMQIPNITLLCGRSEELGHNTLHRERYDVVTCRALAPLNILLELAAPFVKEKGIILCWKSLTIEQELKDSLLARAELSCQMQEPYVYDLGGTWGRRQILVFTKRAKTSEKYPRAVGEPKKNPLL